VGTMNLRWTSRHEPRNVFIYRHRNLVCQNEDALVGLAGDAALADVVSAGALSPVRTLLLTPGHISDPKHFPHPE